MAVYEMARDNVHFQTSLVNTHDGRERPVVSLLSYTSYLVSHARKSGRAHMYARLNLLTIWMLLESPICVAVFIDKAVTPRVHICRQRSPVLPHSRTEQPLIAAIMDVLVCGLSYNMKRRLDVDAYRYVERHGLFWDFAKTHLAYTSGSCTGPSPALHDTSCGRVSCPRCLGAVLTLVAAYHWGELWRALFSLLRLLAAGTSAGAHYADVPYILLGTLHLVIVRRDFLFADAKPFDDFFYRLIEATEEAKTILTQGVWASLHTADAQAMPWTSIPNWRGCTTRSSSIISASRSTQARAGSRRRARWPRSSAMPAIP